MRFFRLSLKDLLRIFFTEILPEEQNKILTEKKAENLKQRLKEREREKAKVKKPKKKDEPPLNEEEELKLI